MQLSELRTLNNRPFTPALAQLKSWNLHVETMDNVKLKAIHQLIKTHNTKRVADQAVKAILQAVKRAEFFGEIEQPLNLWFDFHGPLTIDDFNTHLEAMTDIHKRIFIFALANNMPLADCIGLNWTQARAILKRKDLNPVARQILDTQVRNVRVDFVFWRYMSDFAPGPIYEADVTIQETIGCRWSDYRRRFHEMTDKPF